MPEVLRIGAILAVLLAAGARQSGCHEQQPAESPAPSPAPIVTPAPAAASPSTPAPTDSTPDSPAPPPPPLDLVTDAREPIREGWATIEEKSDEQARAWVEGSVEGDDRIVIATQNVRRFRLDLSRLRVDWGGRVVLRMDGFNSELTRKRWPVVHFVRTPSGAWAVVDD